MKNLILTVFAFCVTSMLSADQWTAIDNQEPTEPQVILIADEMNATTVRFEMNGFFQSEVLTENGLASKIMVPEMAVNLEKGSPDVLSFSSSIIIDAKASTEVSVIHEEYIEYENFTLAPSKGNLTRNQIPSEIAYSFNEVYSTDAFYPGNLVALRDPYIIRNVRGQAIVFNPIQYNPVTQVLRVYTAIEVAVNHIEGTIGVNAKQFNITAGSQEFDAAIKHHFLNAESASRYEPTEEDGGMLIIAYPDFIPSVQPLANWKNQKGIRTQVVNMNDIGSSDTEIAAFVEQKYLDEGISFVLLVGDHEFVPARYSTVASGYSDVMYGYIEGDDHYPEILVGRFSAETAAEVQTMVERTIFYEKDAIWNNVDPSWYAQGAVIGSNEGPGDDGEDDWQHARNMRYDLLDYTYDHVYEFYDGTHGEEDADSNPNATMVEDVIESGISLITYTGHGSSSSCATTGLSSSSVSNLRNVGKYLYFFSVACVNGDFVGQTCFAEEWLRATNNETGEPTGAIGVLMASINQPWSPPMSGQDEMIDLVAEIQDNNIKRTFGGISMNGCMQMNDDYGNGGYYVTDTWNCFGDPSFEVRTKAPAEIEVTHEAIIFIGASTFQVQAGTDDAMVALTLNNEILGTARISGGSAELILNQPIASVDELLLTVTAKNKIAYQANISSLPVEGPYVTFTQSQLSDANGNNNGQADAGETLQIETTFENVGADNATDATAVLTSDSEFVDIMSGSVALGSIDAGNTIEITDGFEFILIDGVPDGTEIEFMITITDSDGNEWITYYTIVAQAPRLEILSLIFDDTEGGDGNLILDAGETSKVFVTVRNFGHSMSSDALAGLSIDNEFITVTEGSFNVGIMDPASGIYTCDFEVMADEETPLSSYIDIEADIEAGAYGNMKLFTERINLIVENWELQSFDTFDWITNEDVPWTLDSDNVVEGNYSLKSGDIGDNGTSTLMLERVIDHDDAISFMIRVSSETSYDFLNFYIDAEIQDKWAGEVGSDENWLEVSFNVSAGLHTFTWVYEKDYFQSFGADAAWIDYIVLPAEGEIVVVECFADIGIIVPPTENIYQPNDFINFANINYNDGDGYSQKYFACTYPGNIVEEISDIPLMSISNEGNYRFYGVNFNTEFEPTFPMNGQSMDLLDGVCYDTNYGDNTNIVSVTIGSGTSVLDLAELGISGEPNPFTNELIIRNNDVKIGVIQILDISGKIVATQELMYEMQTIQTSGLASGMYFLQMRIENKIYNQKLIKR